MGLQPVDVDGLADRLRKPFVMEPLAEVDHFSVYVYLCTGAVARHRHLTQDELFYCHTGMLTLETDWGTTNLLRHEFAVVPRGLAHVSGSIMRTVVLFFQARADPDRKNGHGRLSADEPPGGLRKWSALEEVPRGTRPFLPRETATVDEMSLRVLRGEGLAPRHAHRAHDELLYTIEGSVQIDTDEGALVLSEGQLVVIPAGQIHRLESSQPSTLVSLIHREVPPAAHMGLDDAT